MLLLIGAFFSEEDYTELLFKCHLVGIDSILEAIVGLEKTFYQVTEDVGVVEVCAIVYSPNANLTCPISFPFDVSLSTGDDSAGIRHCSTVCIYMMTVVLH